MASRHWNNASKLVFRNLKLCILSVLIVLSMVALFHLEGVYRIPESRVDELNSSGDGKALGNRATKIGGRSDAWVPVVMHECDGLDPRSAPCLKQKNNISNMISAHEMLYRPFKLAVPGFINNSHRDHWAKEAMSDVELQKRMTLKMDESAAIYPAQFGQNLVFENAQFTGIPPPDIWSEDSCMGSRSDHRPFLDAVNVSELNDALETLVIATVPDSWSWQHFLDRVTVVWCQSMLDAGDSFMSKNVTLVSGTQPQQRVNELYDIMRVKHIHGVPRVAAKKLVFSCRAPLIHPFTSQRFNDLIGWEATKTDKRNVVLMMSRVQSRQILNQDKLNQRVEDLLRTRGKDEVLEIFDQNQLGSMVDIISFMKDRVKMVIGPHGGAMYNIRFASPGSVLLEFMPAQRFAPVFWEQARLFEHHYYCYICNSLDTEHNMEIDNLDAVVNWIDDILNKQEHSPLPTVEPHYHWQVK